MPQFDSLEEDIRTCTPSQKKYVKVNAVVFCVSVGFLALGLSFFGLPRCQSRHASGEDFKDACRLGLGFMVGSAIPLAATMPVTLIACLNGFFSCKKQAVDPTQPLLPDSNQAP